MSESPIADCFRALARQTTNRLSDYENALFDCLIDNVACIERGDAAPTARRETMYHQLAELEIRRFVAELADARAEQPTPAAPAPVAAPKLKPLSKSPWRKTMYPIAKRVP